MEKTCLSYEQTVDRLRSLPHPIRNHILSFLPMEEAVKTSVLSRQWRYVSSSLSNLEFNQIDYQEKMQNDIHSIDFRNFVDHLIIIHDGTHMGSFSLTVYIDDVLIKDTNINTWIFFAIMHNVQELCLNIESGTVEKLPACFYSCCSLTVLPLNQLVLSFADDPDNRAIKILMGQCKTVTLSPRGCYLE
ncbi:hypothetical protein IFM89_026443, partial [Coptis chinensis]